MRERQERWDARFMELAKLVSTWSKDPSTKVGAVLVDPTRRIMSTGYNGFPRGVSDEWTRYADREQKYAMVVHAELNALLCASSKVSGCTLYVTMAPCSECAKSIIQSGVDRVVWSADPDPAMSIRWAISRATMRTMFDEAGVDVEIL
tara:strand:+ start:14615 stop:15058 length:444 start_codon:yes stop_codon:yes gene_type:complete